MAEWLRRWTRNPLGSPRAGSNPADYVELKIHSFYSSVNFNKIAVGLLAILKKSNIYM